MDDTKKLVDWENAPKVSDLQKDLVSAEPSYSKHVSDVQGWLKSLAGELKIDIPKGRSKIQPKLLRTQAEWRYASLEEPFLSARDLWEFSPRTEEDVQAAKDNELLLNFQWNTQMDKTAFINEYVRTNVDEGTAITQIGWETIEEEQEVEVEVEATPEQKQMYFMNLVAQGQMSEEEAYQRIQDPTPITTMTTEIQMVPVVDKPTYRIWEYDRIIIDPTCEGDLSTAKFIATPFETNKSELLQDSSYDKDAVRSLFDENGDITITADTTDDQVMSSFDKHLGFDFNDSARKRLTAYEYFGYWDIDGEGITKPIRAVWVSGVMIKLEELPYKKLPFVATQYLPVRKSVYGEPDAVLIEDKQDVMGALYRGALDVIGRSANGQTAMSKGYVDEANKAKFESGKNYFFNHGHDPRTSVHMHTHAEVPNSALNLIQMQTQEAESLTGSKMFSGGISGQALGNTATSARGALDASARRELSILRRLSAGLEKIARFTVELNKEFLDAKQTMRITGNEFKTVDKDDLQGNFDLRIRVSTADSDNQKAEELAFMNQTNAAKRDPSLNQLIEAEIADLRNMPELAEKIRGFQPQPDPMQQKQAELQIALLEAQVANERAKGMENQVDVQLKQAKTQSELAKANKTGSETDKLDKDFVEEYTGIKHNRDVDLKGQGKQAVEGAQQWQG